MVFLSLYESFPIGIVPMNNPKYFKELLFEISSSYIVMIGRDFFLIVSVNDIIYFDFIF